MKLKNGAHSRGRRLWTVRARLMLVAFLSVATLLGFVALDGLNDWRQQVNLRNDSATGELGGEASLPLFVGAQQERRLTAAYLARPTDAAKRALDKQRAATDKGARSFRRLSGTKLETDHRHKWQYVERVYHRLDGLAETRRQADRQTVTPDRARHYYTQLLGTMVEFYQALSAMDDAELTEETRPLVGLFWASEGASQEDALVAQARAAGHMSPAQRQAFAEAHGAQRVMYQRWIAPFLPPKDKALYERIVDGPAWKRLQGLERDVISAPTSSEDGAVEQLPGSLDRWDATYGSVAQQTAQLNLSRTQGLLAHGYQRADEIRTTVYLKAGGGLATVVVLTLLIVGIIRSITSRLRSLEQTAHETAVRLPLVVDRLRRGEAVEVTAEFPQRNPRLDEFAGLEGALGSAQRTALEVASEQAADRRGFGGFVRATCGRALNLVEVQLDLLEELERKHDRDAEVLRDFIRVDHRAGLVRRHLDNLQTAADGHQEPYTEQKALADLVFDAAAESQDPERVVNKVRTAAWVRPQAVNAVMHILSALLDNALSFSHENVTVTSVSPVKGVAVELEDMGTGMSEEEYRKTNQLLAQPPNFEDLDRRHDGRLGLFVVARLAAIYELRVSLRPGDYGGAKAVVLLPHAVLGDTPGEVPATAPQLAPHAVPDAARPATRHEADALGGPQRASVAEPFAAPPLPETEPLREAGPMPEAAPMPEPEPPRTEGEPRTDPARPAPLPRRVRAERTERGVPEPPAPPAPLPAPGVPTQPSAPEGALPPAPPPVPHSPTTPPTTRTPVHTDEAAPPLPKRRHRSHMAPELAQRTAEPAYDPETDATPEYVGSNWGAWQRATRAAEQSSTIPREDETR